MADSGITKKAFAAAFKELLRRENFEKITVGAICEQCGMNRKSFYYHFKDRYELVNWIYYTEFVETLRAENSEDMWAALEDICRYFYDNGDFYVKVLEYQGQNSFREYFAAVLQPLLSGYLSETVPGDEHQAFLWNFLPTRSLFRLKNGSNAGTGCRRRATSRCFKPPSDGSTRRRSARNEGRRVSGGRS